jgi:hypothetical protein
MPLVGARLLGSCPTHFLRRAVLGSGFLVRTELDLIAITVSHVMTEWADRVRPPQRHAFTGLRGCIAA